MTLAVKDANGATQNIPFPNGNGQAPMAASAPVVIASDQIVAVSVASLPLAAGAAADGTDGIGITPPTGATGIRGWLSGIYNRLGSPLSVTGAFWQATQPVSVAALPALAAGSNSIGSISNSSFGISGTLPNFAAPPTVNIGSAPSIAVTGTFYQASQPVSIATMPNTPVTGTFWQATQPVSAAALPLPAGAATAAGQTAAQGTVAAGAAPANTSVAGAVYNTSPLTLTNGQGAALQGDANGYLKVNVAAGSAATPTGTAGAPNAGVVSVQGIAGGTGLPVTAAALPLPTGAATAANQTANQGTVAAGAAPANTNVTGAVYNAAAPALTTGQSAALQSDASGNLKVNIAAGAAGTPTGAAGSPNANVVTVQGVGGGTGLAVAQSGTWNIGTIASLPALAAGSATIGAISNAGFGITGTLPAFAATPTFNLGTAPSLTIGTLPALPTGTNTIGTVVANAGAGTFAISAASLPLPAGAATASGVAAVVSALGTPLQAGGNVAVSSLPALPAGANLIGAVNLDLGGSPLSAANPLPVLDAYTAPSALAWTSATAMNSASAVTTAGYDTVIVTLVGNGSLAGGTVAFEVFDGAAWIAVKAGSVSDYTTGAGATLAANMNRGYQIPVAGFPQFRVRLSAAITAGSLTVTTITSSAPDTSIVTVGLDPAQPLPAGTNTLGTVLGPLPASPVTGQQTLTTTAAALPGNSLQNGLIVTALSTNTGTVYVGAGAVTTASGYPLSAGQSISFGVANASGISIIGTNATDKVAYAGN